ncbi:MAG: TRAP transporter substrate-binding protein [Paracoccaceae bacterium]
MKGLLALATAATLAFGAQVSAGEISLSYFMSPKHPMNKAVFTPFSEKLAEVSGGELTVKMFPAGALNSVPPKQYSILLDGIADVVFALPGYTGALFPKTNVVTLPGVCDSASACTTALLNARAELETEYNAKVLAIWANAPPVLITRDKAVRTLEDMKGLKIRVTAKQDVAFMEALGASAVAQPVTVINQNLANGVIDGIAIGPSAIGSFKLQEPGNFLTTWMPGSGSAFVLLMNQGVFDALSEEEQGWVNEAAAAALSESGGTTYGAAAARGMKIAADAGLEIIDLSDEEKARFNEAIADTLASTLAGPAGDKTVGDIISLMQGN